MANLIRRELISLPRWEDIGSKAQSSFYALEDAISLLRDSGATEARWEALSKLPLGPTFAIEHPLSWAYPVSVISGHNWCERTRLEFEVVNSMEDVRCKLDRNEQNSLAIMDAMAARLTQTNTIRRRTGDVSTSIVNGSSVIFPPPEHIDSRLTQIFELVFCDTRDVPASFRAALVLVATTNSHPYEDGNGRLSRCLFNVALRARAATPFVPLNEFALRGRGALVLWQRQVELRSDWGGLAQYLTECAVAFSDLLKKFLATGCAMDLGCSKK